MRLTAGYFEIDISEGGYPVLVTIQYKENMLIRTIHHEDILDLEYLIKRAKSKIKIVLGERLRHEID